MSQLPPESLKPSWYFLLACLLCSLPILTTTYPPMVDLPQHAAQIGLLRDYFSGGYHFADLFELNLFTPYWLGYGVAWLLSYLVGTTLAIKLTLCAALILFPYTCALLREQAKAPNKIDWFFLPIAFGFAYEWGFFNFLIAMPFGMLFIRSAIKYRDTPTPIGSYIIAAWVIFLFVSHILAMAFFCTLSALTMYKKNDKLTTWLIRISPLFVAIPLTIIWLIPVLQEAQAQTQGYWDFGLHRFANFVPSLLSLPASIPHIALALLTCAFPLLLGGRISKDPGKLLPFGFYTLWMLFAPNFLMGNSFTYNRFGLLGLPLYFIMFDFMHLPPTVLSKNLQKYLAAIPIVIGLLLLNLITAKSLGYEKESEGYRIISEKIPNGMRILNLSFSNSSAYYKAPIYLHYPSWYQGEQHGIVDFNFASFYPQVIHYKREHKPPIDQNLVWAPRNFNWKQHKGDTYAFFIVRSDTDRSQDLHMISNNIKLVDSIPPWWLYKNEKQLFLSRHNNAACTK